MNVLSPKKVAEMLGTSTATLSNLRHRGKGIPYTRMGRKIFYLESEIEKYLMERMVSSTAEYSNQTMQSINNAHRGSAS
jgi:predicted site-specific integrase-resolvase